MAIWTGISVTLPLAVHGLNTDGVTRLLIVLFFALQLLWYWARKPTIGQNRPLFTFVALSTANAMIGEICYMISTPLHTSLRITSTTSMPTALKFIATDLVLTLPAYLLIFSVVAYLITRYRYSAFLYFLLIGLGQSLGDGNSFFVLNPGSLILLPYIMLNYWAMSFVPFLLVRPHLNQTSLSPSKPMAIILPLLLLPVTYFAAASVILTLGKQLGWLLD